MREHWGEFVTASVLLPLFGWFGVNLFGLNREVGQLTQQLNGLRSEYEHRERHLDQREERLRADFERLRTRLDQLLTVGGPQPPKK